MATLNQSGSELLEARRVDEADYHSREYLPHPDDPEPNFLTKAQIDEFNARGGDTLKYDEHGERYRLVLVPVVEPVTDA